MLVLCFLCVLLLGEQGTRGDVFWGPALSRHDAYCANAIWAGSIGIPFKPGISPPSHDARKKGGWLPCVLGLGACCVPLWNTSYQFNLLPPQVFLVFVIEVNSFFTLCQSYLFCFVFVLPLRSPLCLPRLLVFRRVAWSSSCLQRGDARNSRTPLLVMFSQILPCLPFR